MPIVAAIPAIIGAGTAVYGASQQKKAASRGADAQQAASDAAIAEQRRQFDLTRSDQAPWLEAGRDALGRQNAFLGGDWSGFENSPDYLYAKQQGLDSIDHRAAARGGLFGGGNTRDAMTFASGLATQNANNYWNKLAGLSNTGVNTAQGLGSMGMNMATNIGNQYGLAANARSSAYQQIGQANMQQGAAIGGALNNLGQGMGWWRG